MGIRRQCNTDDVSPGGRVRARRVAPYWEVLARDGTPIPSVEQYLLDFWARGMSPASVESYARDLLRWHRFLWGAGREWNRVTREDVRDFVMTLREMSKRPTQERRARPAVNEVSGKPYLGDVYSPRTINHNLSVISAFYDFHRRALTGPLRNPVPERLVDGGRFGAHHNPEHEHRQGRRADYRQKVPVQAPRSIPDMAFKDLFTALGTDRDRAMVAFYVSSAARPSELVGLTNGMVDVGQQCISVVRKGSGDMQRIPASPEAFRWFRLYQESLPEELVRSGSSAWWTLRKPYRPLNYEATRAILRRVNIVLGANWTLHDFRHTAATRMARDPEVSLTDIQAVLGHVHLTTTEAYLKPRMDDVIERVNLHFSSRAADARPSDAAPGRLSPYSPDDMTELFGDTPWR
jgi:site-specific recombinase XerD